MPTVENMDWLPTNREAQLAMAQNWVAVLGNQTGNPWNIPEAEQTALDGLSVDAERLLGQAQSSARTTVITAECKTAFAALLVKMRFVKSRYFLAPPLSDADFTSLELQPKDTTRTPVPPPAAQAEADVTRPGVHILALHLKAVADSPPDPHRADYGFRVYFGVLSPDGASAVPAAGLKRELTAAPVSGEELPHSRFTRRKKETFDFPAEDSGKTVYFCVRYENAKGESGPWGPLFSAVIP
ncbi:hypothetical protein [Treponema endosymbiont of Eucomonympha sp.]|uniref:hypothetical protein n=1 Tax=Treponema endosymbiont of Eucomonympha sp. TaxID=1580831 RepID=UPI000AEF7D8C|nr:hypothetical protein [Treponema endosymbiont of Eucomonympha sp.]